MSENDRKAFRQASLGRRPPHSGCCMKRHTIAVIMFIVAGIVAVPQSHAGESTEATFLDIVKNERLRVCVGSSIPTCNSDFDRPALFAEWLDAEEERATAIENSGETETAQAVRMKILSDAAMLDIWMDQIRLLHRKN